VLLLQPSGLLLSEVLHIVAAALTSWPGLVPLWLYLQSLMPWCSHKRTLCCVLARVGAQTLGGSESLTSHTGLGTWSSCPARQSLLSQEVEASTTLHSLYC
jgi:hypothetical protein